MKRHMTWLNGVKFKVMAGIMRSVSQSGTTHPRQLLVSRWSVYIAPLGLPVLPEAKISSRRVSRSAGAICKLSVY